MSAPKRIQMSRQRPWRADNPDAVIVSRPSRWGNPVRWWPSKPVPGAEDYTGITPDEARALEVQGFREMLADPDARAVNEYPSDDEIVTALAGRDLACWCPLPEPGKPDICHAAVLLEIGNV